MFWNSQVLEMFVSPMKSVISNLCDTNNDLISFKYIISHYITLIGKQNKGYYVHGVFFFS